MGKRPMNPVVVAALVAAAISTTVTSAGLTTARVRIAQSEPTSSAPTGDTLFRPMQKMPYMQQPTMQLPGGMMEVQRMQNIQTGQKQSAMPSMPRGMMPPMQWGKTESKQGGDMQRPVPFMQGTQASTGEMNAENMKMMQMMQERNKGMEQTMEPQFAPTMGNPSKMLQNLSTILRTDEEDDAEVDQAMQLVDEMTAALEKLEEKKAALEKSKMEKVKNAKSATAAKIAQKLYDRKLKDANAMIKRINQGLEKLAQWIDSIEEETSVDTTDIE